MMKISKERFVSAIDYLREIEKLSLKDMDFTNLIGRDLSEKEKDRYFWSHERKTQVEIVTIIFKDYKEGKL